MRRVRADWKYVVAACAALVIGAAVLVLSTGGSSAARHPTAKPPTTLAMTRACMSYLDAHYKDIAPFGFGVASQGAGHPVRREASGGWALTGVAQVEQNPSSAPLRDSYTYPGMVMSAHYRCVTTASARVIDASLAR